jgi:hypothetical protein
VERSSVERSFDKHDLGFDAHYNKPGTGGSGHVESGTYSSCDVDLETWCWSQDFKVVYSLKNSRESCSTLYQSNSTRCVVP